MSDQERNGLVSYYGIFAGVLSFISLGVRYFAVGPETLIPSILILLSGVALGFVVDFWRLKKKKLAFVSLSLSCGFYLSNALCDLFYFGSSPMESTLAIMAVSSPVLLLFPLLSKMGMKKTCVAITAMLTAVICSYAVHFYLISYLYLYESIANLSWYTSVYKVLFLLIVLTMLGELFLKGERIYSGYFLLAALVLGFGYLGIYEESEAFSLAAFGKNLQNSYQALWLFLILIIYIGMEKTEEIQVERRNVVFSNMVYEELKPIQKKKIQKFEIPPNIPKRKDYNEEYEGYVR